jgi:two-component system, OmpR family, phosphate regulon sensor histidine kinase PhoR
MQLQEATPHILVVEDEPSMRQGIYRILTRQGLEVSTAASGEEALTIIGTETFPLVLVDLKMPGIDGFELIERINSVKPGTICVVVSALATVAAVVKTTKMGTFDFVVKPFVPDELMVVVNRAIEKWRTTSETHRLRAEREAHLLQLSAEKSRLRTIVQSMGDGLLVVNIDRNVVLDNAAARSILGRIEDQRQLESINDVIPDQRVCDQIGELLVNPKAQQVKMEIMLAPRHDQGSPIYVRVTLAPFRDENNRLLGVAVLLADISETKAYERMKTMFISMVAHEIKAPIAAIESYLNIIENGILDHDVPRIKGIAARCLERSSALLAMVQDLLEITRQDAIQNNRVIDKLDVLELAKKLADFHRVPAAERNITIELSAHGALKPLMADAAEIERMLTNLLSNAIKYNRDGGKIWVRLDASASALRIEVEDNGIGMSPEDARRVGEEFFRVKDDKTRTITGTGLGLALVKRIVKSYYGSLEVESQPERGSLFRILIPLDEPEQVAMGT